MKSSNFAFQFIKHYHITMRKRHLMAAIAIATLTACSDKKTTQSESTASDSVSTITLRDSTIWGHLGEDTGMSTLQFITDQGDTLDIYRTSQYTGQDGELLGEVRNYTDRFAITLAEGNETLLRAINVTQLARQWHTTEGSLNIKPDGTASADGLPYNGWKLWNGHLLLSSEQQQEYGTATRVDTMDIVRLDDDSLVIQDHIKRFLILYNPI